ncbi:uncharacterized protein BJ212DRAFT_1475992 [Suillus subaureus]|uniref:Uncharacterized protein n=1 Tax=Suillus subaureus TaxID=48587 RepID=A0A9P7JIX9_9AGAM|nr:uncharacterized protein BJ212DRAFT_1475992 [Suillus subaureus]KAG1824699.1 hypothetical protein BJ212DRAFT_1475992 [Suillus subaureus]
MGHNLKTFKSAEFIDDSDSLDDDGSILDISLTSSNSNSSGSSTAFVFDTSIFNFNTQDSIDHELDAMAALPPAVEPIPVAEPLQAPKVKSKKKKSKQPRPVTPPPNEPEVIPAQVAPLCIKATYSITILPHSELKKGDIKKCVGTATILSLYLDEPFDTFKAQVLQKIKKETNPTILSFENYKTFFTIVHIAPQPTSLADEDDYQELIKCLQQMSTPAATIYIQELLAVKKHKDWPSDKENNREINEDNNHSSSESSDDSKKRNKKKKKTKAPKAADIDKEMKSINKNIKALLDRNNGSHVHLTFPLLECWVAAMEKGPEYATLEMPPNHSSFGVISSNSLGWPSLLSVCHQQLDEQSKKATQAEAVPVTPAPAQAMPIININFPPEMFQAICAASDSQPVHHAPVPALLLPAVLPPAVPASLSSLLLSTQLASLGPRMNLTDFCSAYELSQILQSKLSNHGFMSSHALRYVTVDDSQKVGLLCGELAELKDAVAHWCGE